MRPIFSCILRYGTDPMPVLVSGSVPAALSRSGVETTPLRPAGDAAILSGEVFSMMAVIFAIAPRPCPAAMRMLSRAAAKGRDGPIHGTARASPSRRSPR